VNLSARIQTLNRKLQTDILLSQATYAALGKPAWLCVSDQGLRRFKGKSVRVRVYSINSEAGQAADQAATLDMPQPEVWIVERMRALGEVRDAA
jgi:class 3 adenylate cyclase